ncbi:glycosyltransferase [Iamia sp. SCSIO 61187]|nr:glycosyltransferase [Iamia sp. SCSIO 61187]
MLFAQANSRGFNVIARHVAPPGTWRARAGRGRLLRAACRETRADIVFLPREFAPRLTVPFVVMARNLYAWLPPPADSEHRLTLWLMRRSAHRSARRAARVIAVSRAIANYLPAGSASPEVIPHGCDLPAGKPVQWPRSGVLRVVMLATVAPHKGIACIIDAIALLRTEHGVSAELAIYGPVPDKSLAVSLRAQSQAVLGYDAIAGPAPLDRRSEILGAADVVAIGSSYESFCLPLVEGMRAGRAVWAPACDLVEELCGDVAVRYAEGSARSAATEMANALPSLEALGSQGIKRSDTFRWDEIAQRILYTLDRAATAR